MSSRHSMVTPAPAGARPDRWHVLRALAGAGLALLAAASVAPGFGRGATEALADPRFVLPVAGAAGLVAVLCLLLAYGTRFAPVSRVATALVALAGYLLLVVAPGWDLVGGPRRLLATTPPVDPTGPELATVVLGIGLATLGAVEPALRRRAALLPVLAPLAAVGLGSAVSAAAGPPPGWLVPAFGLGAAALLILARQAARTAHSDPGDPTSTTPGPAVKRGPAAMSAGSAALRPLAAGVAVAAVAAAGWYGPDLLGGAGRPEPVDPRQLVPQPVDSREATSPLVLFPALRGGEQNLSLTVHASHPLERLRYVTLNRFDGQYWTTTAQYRRAGRRLPLGPARPAGSAREERVEIEIAGALGWLVSSGRPVEVSVPGLGVNEDTGDVVLPAGRPMPTGYTVRSVLAEPDPDLLEVATPIPAAPDDVLLSTKVGRLLTQQAPGLVGSAGYGYPALHALAEHLRGYHVDVSSDPLSGHGLAQIDTLLEEQVGTAEQYASAFAVLARALGYQSRVVVGFRPRPVDGQPGTYRVTGPTVHAWAEVRFEALGWVGFDPTPVTESTGADQPGTRPEQPPAAPDSPDDQQDTGQRPDAEAAGSGGASGSDPGRLVAGYAGPVLAGLLGLLALGAAAVPLAKAGLRRRRRATSDPGRRVLAAWRDTVDRLVEAGVPVAAADTAGEVAAATGARLGDRVGQPVRRLAVGHDATAYAPAQPAAPAAATAWQDADLVRRTLRDTRRPVARLRAALSPRPLLFRFPGKRLGGGGRDGRGDAAFVRTCSRFPS